MTHRIALLLYPDFQLLDAAGPMAVFEAAFSTADGPLYAVTVCSADGGLVRSSGGAYLESSRFADAAAFDTIVLCGGVGAVGDFVDPRVIDFLVAHNRREGRVASICTGAFVLARAGLLDGRAATTHWRFAGDLGRRYPGVSVCSDRIWTRDGGIWTSAGVTAGIDLALAIVAEDHGEALAREIAQELVVYHRRPGGQSQFSALLDIASPAGRFASLLSWAREHLHEPLPVERLADRVAMSARNFARVFALETGMTPAKAIERIRVEVARGWVERDTQPLSVIAAATGFGTADRMRLAFLRAYGMPPQAIRRVS